MKLDGEVAEVYEDDVEWDRFSWFSWFSWFIWVLIKTLCEFGGLDITVALCREGGLKGRCNRLSLVTMIINRDQTGVLVFSRFHAHKMRSGEPPKGKFGTARWGTDRSGGWRRCSWWASGTDKHHNTPKRTSVATHPVSLHKQRNNT